MATISLDQWHGVLRQLKSQDLFNSLEPRSIRDELIRGGITTTEFEVISAGVTRRERMYRLYRFIKTRPSVHHALSEALSRVHPPLYNVLRDALSQLTPFEDRQRFRTALNHRQEELKVLGEWAMPQLLALECVSEAEVEEVRNRETDLASLLAERSPSQQRALVDFLRMEHSDLLFLIRSAYDASLLDRGNSLDAGTELTTILFRHHRSHSSPTRSGRPRVASSSEHERFERDRMSLRSRILELEGIRNSIMDENHGLRKDNEALRRRIKEFEKREVKNCHTENGGQCLSSFDPDVRSVFLANLTGHAPNGKVVLPLPPIAKVGSVRKAIAELLGTAPERISLKQFVGVDPESGERLLMVWDDIERWLFTTADGNVTVSPEKVKDRRVESIEVDEADMVLPCRYSIYLRVESK